MNSRVACKKCGFAVSTRVRYGIHALEVAVEVVPLEQIPCPTLCLCLQTMLCEANDAQLVHDSRILGFTLGEGDSLKYRRFVGALFKAFVRANRGGTLRAKAQLLYDLGFPSIMGFYGLDLTAKNPGKQFAAIRHYLDHTPTLCRLWAQASRRPADGFLRAIHHLSRDPQHKPTWVNQAIALVQRRNQCATARWLAASVLIEWFPVERDMRALIQKRVNVYDWRAMGLDLGKDVHLLSNRLNEALYAVHKQTAVADKIARKLWWAERLGFEVKNRKEIYEKVINKRTAQRALSKTLQHQLDECERHFHAALCAWVRGKPTKNELKK